jgi:hypothetical protein
MEVEAKDEDVDLDDDMAKDAVLALEADTANDDVPCKLPVIPVVTVNEPVIVPPPSEIKPRFILNSFAISVHYPRLVILL